MNFFEFLSIVKCGTRTMPIFFLEDELEKETVIWTVVLLPKYICVCIFICRHLYIYIHIHNIHICVYMLVYKSNTNTHTHNVINQCEQCVEMYIWCYLTTEKENRSFHQYNCHTFFICPLCFHTDSLSNMLSKTI